MRSKYRDIDYFNSIIEFAKNSEQRRLKKIENGEISEKRINAVYIDLSNNFLNSLKCKYSAGFEIQNIREDLDKSIEYFLKGASNGYGKLKYSKEEIYNQYGGSFYEQLLSILSISFLLSSPTITFLKLIEIIDNDKVKDLLFEFIICRIVDQRIKIEEESYQKYFNVPEIYKTLRLAINEANKSKTTSLIEQYITTEWYSNHKEFGWYGSHNKDSQAFTGYWSFETAAIVAILDIDDKNFRNCEFYPKDLVDFYRSNS